MSSVRFPSSSSVRRRRPSVRRRPPVVVRPSSVVVVSPKNGRTWLHRGRKRLKLKLSGTEFHGESESGLQKTEFPPKRAENHEKPSQRSKNSGIDAFRYRISRGVRIRARKPGIPTKKCRKWPSWGSREIQFFDPL